MMLDSGLLFGAALYMATPVPTQAIGVT